MTHLLGGTLVDYDDDKTPFAYYAKGGHAMGVKPVLFGDYASAKQFAKSEGGKCEDLTNPRTRSKGTALTGEQKAKHKLASMSDAQLGELIDLLNDMNKPPRKLNVIQHRMLMLAEIQSREKV